LTQKPKGTTRNNPEEDYQNDFEPEGPSETTKGSVSLPRISGQPPKQVPSAQKRQEKSVPTKRTLATTDSAKESLPTLENQKVETSPKKETQPTQQSSESLPEPNISKPNTQKMKIQT